MNRMLSYSQSILHSDFNLKLNIKNNHKSPKLKKGVITLTKVPIHPSSLSFALLALWAVSLQKPSVISAKKSIAQSRVFAGDLIGAKVTLRKKFLFNFLEIFINQGLSTLAQRTPGFKGLTLTPNKKNKNNCTLYFSNLRPLFFPFSYFQCPIEFSGKVNFIFILPNCSNSELISDLYLRSLQFPLKA